MEDLIIKEIVQNAIGDAFTIVKCLQKNKRCTLHIHGERTDRPNAEMVDKLRDLDIAEGYISSSFFMSKKDLNYSGYHIHFSIADKYFNGIIDTDNSAGQFLQFSKDFDIKSTKDFVDKTIDYISNLALYCHHPDIDKTYKKYLRGIKKTYLRFLYNEYMLDKVSLQKSYCNDDLYLFEIGNKSFHLRAWNTNFVENPVILHEVYQKKEKDFSNLDLSFEKYLHIFANINNRILTENAKIVKTIKMSSIDLYCSRRTQIF